MTVEFVGYCVTNDGTEAQDRTGKLFDLDYAVRVARAHEEAGWDRILLPYGARWPDPAQLAGAVATSTERLQLLIAHRPNTCHPTYAAKAFATLDHTTGGRVSVHFLAGGNEAEQFREGDYLPKQERYARMREYIEIVAKTWTATEPFDHQGAYYRFENFVSHVRPTQYPGPAISVAGSSPAAIALGAELADVCGIWADTLEGTATQIAAIRAAAQLVGRVAPRVHAGLRVIMAPTDDLAWQKAYDIADRIVGRGISRRTDAETASVSMRERATASERYDRALWTVPAKLIGGGAPTATLVGSPDTIVESLLDYVAVGVDNLAITGFGHLDAEAAELGRLVLPTVRAEAARRSAAVCAATEEQAVLQKR